MLYSNENALKIVLKEKEREGEYFISILNYFFIYLKFIYVQHEGVRIDNISFQRWKLLARY